MSVRGFVFAGFVFAGFVFAGFVFAAFYPTYFFPPLTRGCSEGLVSCCFFLQIHHVVVLYLQPM